MEEKKQKSKQQSTNSAIALIDDTSCIEKKIKDKKKSVEEAKEEAFKDKIGNVEIESEDLREDSEEE